MTGQQLYDDILTPTLADEQIDQNYALALFNVARLDFEQRRPWQVLKAKDTSLTALSGQNPTVPYAMPTPATPSLTTPYLTRYLLEGSIRLVNTGNSNQIIGLREIPFENQLDYTSGNFFYSDYAKREFYILGNLPSAFTIAQFFIADFGDITLTTSWVGFPSRFHPMIAFQAAARNRLGADYDDIAARNADQNFQTAEAMYKAMVSWDSNIAQQVATNRPFGANYGGGGGYYPRPAGYDNYGVD